MSDKDASGVPIIDFDALAQTNPEVVGWIYAPGTNINYPVVQTNNNSKYLNTLFDGTANASGAIFLDSDDTAPGMVDQQTTIYEVTSVTTLVADAARSLASLATAEAPSSISDR